MDKIKFKNEPVVYMALIQAILFFAISFGLDLTGEQEAAIMGLSAAVLTIVTRSQVSPNSKVLIHEDDEFEIVTPEDLI